jgi:heterodisulfide reductase subunit C
MTSILPQVIFALLLAAAFAYFNKHLQTIRRNILLGRDQEIKDEPYKRWLIMLKVAIGQSKMVVRPVAGILHIFVYVGFLVVNVEVIEILIDGLAGTHRILAGLLGPLYSVMTGAAEFFMLLVFCGAAIFLVRRNILKLPRFSGVEMTNWPRLDANIILITELILVIALVIMNASDQALQVLGHPHYAAVGFFPISGAFTAIFTNIAPETLILIERTAWWFHIIGVLLFLNYIPFSKHFHIFMAFPNTYYSNLNAKGKFPLNELVKKEVQYMLNPALPVEAADTPQRFGAKDALDLTWKNLMDAYTCTECGRCTSSCPANTTGKLLSPRKIMMDTRDRIHEIGNNIDKNGAFVDDGKSLLGDYITPEEIWACNTCNACTEACPVNIDPLSIILQLRQYLVMEESKAPEALNAMFANIENNGAPWPLSAMDRFNWSQDISFKSQN